MNVRHAGSRVCALKYSREYDKRKQGLRLVNNNDSLSLTAGLAVVAIEINKQIIKLEINKIAYHCTYGHKIREITVKIGTRHYLLSFTGGGVVVARRKINQCDIVKLYCCYIEYRNCKS